jgi:peptide/nickel transport system substrate-binding protein
MRRRSTPTVMLGLVLVLAGLAWETVTAQTPRRGGVVNAMASEDPPGLSIHESSTINSVWPLAPCYSNLVIFDPLKPQETAETVVPELAERWSWQDNYRNLVFFLRKNVRWHDGQAFTAADVKYTFDIVREAKEASGRLRLSPRKDWYTNIEAIEAPDAYTVVFRLKRPQPSLLLMLATGYSPVYPAHVPLADLRTRCVGTGPFKLKQYARGQIIELERNGDYFLPGRPYLDGLRYVIITERGTRLAALQSGQLDVGSPLEMTKDMADTIKKNVPSMVVTEIGQNGSDNVILNHKRPPFDSRTVRRAVTLAMDRDAHVQVVRHGGAFVGAALMPPPFGLWGLPDKELRKLAGYRGSAADKAEARQLLATAGFGPGKPLRVELVTRTLPIYIDLASFVADQLRQVGIEAAVKQIDTAQYFPMLARREYQIGANLTAGTFDDPDALFFENYKCGTARNYTDYCNEQVDTLIDLQSQELDRVKRQKLVWDIERKLEADVARPMLAWRKEYFTQWPRVKNLVPHNSLYNYARMQEVWVDR